MKGKRPKVYAHGSCCSTQGTDPLNPKRSVSTTNPHHPAVTAETITDTILVSTVTTTVARSARPEHPCGRTCGTRPQSAAPAAGERRGRATRLVLKFRALYCYHLFFWNHTIAALARLDALENDNAGFEVADPNNDDDEASLDDEDGYMQKKQSKGTKRKTRQAKALEARKAPRTFLELLHEVSD
ncbi:hypothetical protein SESBI_42471 [Sesbania bispinosa]|nr:hypothetical protein SESBI_42471 [Sesbania bispinosa]